MRKLSIICFLIPVMFLVVSCRGNTVYGKLIGPNGNPMEKASIAVKEIEEIQADSAYGIIDAKPFTRNMGDGINMNLDGDTFDDNYIVVKSDTDGKFTLSEIENGTYIMIITYDLPYDFVSDERLGLESYDGFVASLPAKDYPRDRIVLVKEFELKGKGLKVKIDISK